MSTAIYEVPFDLLQEWLLQDDTECGVFVPERFNGTHINVGDYVVVQNFGFFGVEHFHAPTLSAVFTNRDECIANTDNMASVMLCFLQYSGCDLEIWHVIDADNRRGKMLRRKDYGFEKNAYMVLLYADLDDSYSHRSIEFDTYSEAHVFATRVVGYPFPKVDVIYRGVHVGRCPVCVGSYRVNSEHARTLEALRQLREATPLDDFFATPCTEWQVI